MNNENLVSLADRTTSEVREIARKGGVASGKSRRAEKTLREQLADSVDDEEVQKKLVSGMIKQASKGNVRAFDSIFNKTQPQGNEPDMDNDQFLGWQAMFGDKRAYDMLKKRGRTDLIAEADECEKERVESLKKHEIIYAWFKAVGERRKGIFEALAIYEDVNGSIKHDGIYHARLEQALKGDSKAKEFILNAIGYSVKDLDEITQKYCINSDTRE